MNISDLDVPGSTRPLARASGTTALGFPIGPASLAAQRERSFGLFEIWQVIFKHRWVILAGLVVGIALSVLATVLTARMYRATATIEINAESLTMVNMGQGPVAVPLTDQQSLQTQYGLLASTALAERVARDLKLVDNAQFVDPSAPPQVRLDQAARTVARDLTIEPVEKSRLAKISFEGPEPALAAAIANAVAQGAIASHMERSLNSNAYARDFLEKRIATVRKRLEESERRLVAYAQRQNIVTIGAETKDGSEGQASQSLDAASLAAANSELSVAQNARVAAQARYHQAAGGGAVTETLQSPTIQSIRQRLAQLRADYQQKRNSMKPEHPEMVDLQSQINALGKDLSREGGSVVSALAAEYRAAASREAEVRGRVERLRDAVLNLRGRSIQYNILQRDLDTSRQLYDALLQRYKQVGASAGVGDNLISIVDPAKRPTAPFKPDPIFNGLLGAFLGLLAGLATAFALEFFTNTVRKLEDVEARLKIPALGVIPKVEKGMSIVEALENPRSAISEAYSSLRSAIQFATPNGAPASLLVTSSSPSEGKTTTSLALAQNFARLGYETLLIDADLRHPSFGVEATDGHGLSSLLVGASSIDEAIVRTSFPNLAIMVAGKLPPSPADLLAEQRLPQLLRELRSTFTIVIIDAPPVLGLADAPILASLCDRTLVIFESEKVRMPVAINTVERLRAANAKILGGVLTKFNARTSGYGYGYGYGYSEAEPALAKAKIMLPRHK